MQYRPLGRTGIKVSPYALGTLLLGASMGNADHDESVRLIHTALDAGINFVDTADAYSLPPHGASEVVVGKALRGRRDNVVLATKFSRPMGDDPNRRGASRRWIVTAVEESLRRLQTDYIDLYQVHLPDPDTDPEETLSALTDLMSSGKIRAIGSSNTPVSDIVDQQWIADRHGLRRFRTEQAPYSLLNRGIETEVLPTAQRFGMGVIAWGPLGQGMLTGRVRRGQTNDLVRSGMIKALDDENRLDAVEELAALAAESGIPMTHMAMSFAITHPGITSALIGPRTIPQLEDLLKGLDAALPDDVLDRIDEIVPPGTDIGRLDQTYLPPAILDPALRRRPVHARAGRTAA
ncbi:aldo/keto reductase [Gordonia metallireducens]|uniref:aldo/keto reductase n=1 Tax=Gordonia metallireducens TaxID=2897779 RepID=UPI001E4A9B7F|nr:aldo/keto reductase [Gordonia metallireducens]